MPFFRRTLDLSRATTRPLSLNDAAAVSKLLRTSAHRHITTPDDVAALVSSAPALGLHLGDELVGAALASWPFHNAAWLRGLVLADNVDIAGGLARLVPAFHACLQHHHVQHLFYAGDVAADAWIQLALQAQGYMYDTDVIVYEKRTLNIPAPGNQAVLVRQAQPDDLPALLAVDQACFAAQWVKDEDIIGPAITGEVPFFIIAELAGTCVGYAFVTTHYLGQLVHLVRIAVNPAAQGQGIGVRLLAEIVAFAVANNAETMTLNTQLENRTAQRLYEWFGFRRTGESQSVLRFDLA